MKFRRSWRRSTTTSFRPRWKRRETSRDAARRGEARRGAARRSEVGGKAGRCEEGERCSSFPAERPLPLPPDSQGRRSQAAARRSGGGGLGVLKIHRGRNRGEEADGLHGRRPAREGKEQRGKREEDGGRAGEGSRTEPRYSQRDTSSAARLSRPLAPGGRRRRERKKSAVARRCGAARARGCDGAGPTPGRRPRKSPRRSA